MDIKQVIVDKWKSQKKKRKLRSKIFWRERSLDEKCHIALKSLDKGDVWYVDSGCSKHMTGGKDNFLNLKKHKGKVTFGDNASSNILGKGTVNVGKAKAKNVFLVENMKPRLSSVSQTCDQGHIYIFNSKKCEIRRKDSRKLVGTASRTPENVYILNT